MIETQTFRGLALVGRETGQLILVTPKRLGEQGLQQAVERALGMDWDVVVQGCRMVEVEVNVREH